MIPYIFQFIALSLLLLVTGIFWGPWFSLHRSNKAFRPAEFLFITRTMAANLVTPMRILMPACILFIGLSVWSYPFIPSTGFYLIAASLLLSIMALLITIMIEVPIVKAIDKWTVTTMPADWQMIRDRWTRFHVVRILLSMGSFGCLIISLMVSNK